MRWQNQARKRQAKKVQALPYADAKDTLRSMRAKVLATFKAPFDVHELLQAVFPRVLLDDLHRLYPLLSDSAQNQYFVGSITMGMDEFTLTIQTGKVGYASPRVQLAVPDLVSPVWAYLSMLARECELWTEAEMIVDYFNAVRATPSAVANYWPCMGALVKASHPIHQLTPGAPYRELRDLGRHIQAIRRSASTVAAGLLCPEPDISTVAVLAEVSINGTAYVPLITRIEAAHVPTPALP